MNSFPLSSVLRRRLLGLLILLLAAAMPAWAQEGAGQAAGEGDHDHEHLGGVETEGVEGTRLLVSDAAGREVYVVDLASGEILGTFSTPGENSRLYATPSGQYGIAVDRDANRVSIIHSGLRLADHGDHMDLLQENPYVMATMNVGNQPTHFWAEGHLMAFFNDGDGTTAVLDERLFGLSLDFTQVQTVQPDHGAAVVLGDTVLSGHLRLDRVDVYRGGDLLETVEGCPRLHGQATREGLAAFGCTDGVLLVRVDGEAVSSAKLDNPAGSPEDARVGTLTAHEASPVIVGNFGAGLAFIEPESETFETLTLPEGPLGFEFSHSGEALFVLTRDGALHAVDPMAQEVLASLDLVAPFDPEAPRAALAVAPEAVYVSSPASGEVLEVLFEDGELTLSRRLEVPGTPSGVAVLAMPGVIH